MKIQTTEDFLRDTILGKVSTYTCCGYHASQHHKLAKYTLTVGKGTYFYCCPICGFGEGGTLSEEVCDELRELQRRQAEKK